jgi:hypothetical protein
LELPEILYKAEYLDSVSDPKGRDFIVASHLFKTMIGDCESWIIVNESIWNEFLVHSVSDNIPNIQKKKDLRTLPSGTAIRRGILKPYD